MSRGGASYGFLSCWLLEAERERAFEELSRPERWTEWWPGVVEASETDAGQQDGIGRRGVLEWRSAIPYRIRFEIEATAVERPHLLAARVSGDLNGLGTWRLFEDRGVCAITYSWSVTPGPTWIRMAAPLAGGVLRWNHDRIMGWGAAGLADRLGGVLIARG